MRRAFVFPGQGAQSVGMGRALADAFPTARLVFEEVDEALGDKLSTIIFEGPEDRLTLTENAQPALMATSLAAVRALEAESGRMLADLGVAVAGHSLGEYSALAATGTLALADSARLLRLRGQAMQAAVPVGQGAMAALLGLEMEDAEQVAAAASEAGGICEIANDNSPGQIVVSGHKEAVERAVALAAERGAKRSVMLPVSAPFHCSLLAPAADRMGEALANVELAAPSLPLIANVSARATTEPALIRQQLVTQVTARVRWRESVLAMAADGVTDLVELGQGKVLTGLARRIDRSLGARAIGTPDDIAAFIDTLG